MYFLCAYYKKNISVTVESARVSFMIDKIDTYQGLPHPIQRAEVYSDVLEMYQENLIEVFLFEWSMKVKWLVILVGCAGICFHAFGKQFF